MSEYKISINVYKDSISGRANITAIGGDLLAIGAIILGAATVRSSEPQDRNPGDASRN